jgi:mRNA interferase MazF
MSIVLKKGMVILVDLNPTKGSETGKIRPCVIVTNDVYNARVPVIQVTPITEWTDRKSQILTNVTVNPDAQNGLIKKSVIDCLQTRPIDHRERLVNVVGSLNKSTIDQIDQALKKVFGLD